MLSKDTKSLLYALGAVLAWSTVSSSFKLALSEFSPLGLLLISSFSATIFLFIYNLSVDRALFKDFTSNLKASLICGLLNPFLYYFVLFMAYDRLKAQEAQALNYTWAIVLSLFSLYFLKQRFRAKDFLALLVSFIGIMIITSKGNFKSFEFSDRLGTGLALGSSFIWAAYWILNTMDKRRAEQKIFYNFLIGFCIIAIYMIILKVPVFSGSGYLLGIFAAIWTGIFEMGLTFLLWQKALEYSSNTAKTTNLVFITPFLSLIFIRFVLGETIHPATLAGLGLIVFSNLMQQRKKGSSSL